MRLKIRGETLAKAKLVIGVLGTLLLFIVIWNGAPVYLLAFWAIFLTFMR